MIDAIIKQWTRTGLLEGVSPEKIESMTVALESQRRFNETHSLPTAFRRISIPLLRRALANVHFCSSLDNNYGEPIVSDIVVETKFDSLDIEADYVAMLSMEVTNWLLQKSLLNFKAFGLVDGKIAVYTG